MRDNLFSRCLCLRSSRGGVDGLYGVQLREGDAPPPRFLYITIDCRCVSGMERCHDGPDHVFRQNDRQNDALITQQTFVVEDIIENASHDSI